MRHPATSIRRAMSAAVLVVVLGAYPAAAGTSSPAGEPAPQGMAVFEWYRLSQVNTYVTEQRLSSLRREGFSTVYADIGEYLEAADQPESWRQQRQLSRLAGELRRFVARASSLGFAVHAVAGGPNWTAESHRYLGPMTLRLIADYNAQYPDERIQGVQFDIEPYVEDSFWENVEVSLQKYLMTLQDIVDSYDDVLKQPNNQDLALGFAIPFWFDGEGDAPRAVGFNGAVKPAAFHLIDMLRGFSKAYVLVMAYRNFASGDDGSIKHAFSELDYASKAREGACACGIVIGQEFTRVTPKKLSFWWTGRTAFRQAVADLTKAYGGLPQFRGVSVDDIDAYEAAGEYGRR